MYSVYPTYSYYQAPFAHRNYMRALAEARAVEMAEAAARREEEEYLQRRLDQLRQECLSSHSQSYQSVARSSIPYAYDLPYHYTNSLESLRLQLEEERLKKLEALHQRQLQLELEQERLRMAASHRPRILTAPFFEEDSLRRSYTKPSSALLNQYGFDPRVLESQQRYGRHICSQVEPNVCPQRSSSCRCAREQISVLPPRSPFSLREPSLPYNLPETPRRYAESPTPVSGLEKLLEDYLGDHSTRSASSFPEEARHFQLLDTAQKAGNQNSSPVTAQTKERELNEALLKEKLEKRLHNEHAKEIQDTLQALLCSLSDSGPITTTSSSTSLPPVSENRTLQTTPSKGKAKEASTYEEGPKVPSSIDIDTAMGRILSIESRFSALENEFVFPENVDFAPTTPLAPHVTPVPAISHLAFTANNQPIRLYEQSLNHLLAELDSIESYGSDSLRKNRKEVVGKVEHALEELEQLVEGRWNAKVARESKKYRVTIEDVSPSEVFLSSTQNSPLTTTSVLEPIDFDDDAQISLSPQEPLSQEAIPEESASVFVQDNTDIVEVLLSNPPVPEVVPQQTSEPLVDALKDDSAAQESSEVLGEVSDSTEVQPAATQLPEDTTPLSNAVVLDSIIDMDATVRPSTATDPLPPSTPVNTASLSTLDLSSPLSTASSSDIELDSQGNTIDDGGFLMENALVDDEVDDKPCDIDGDSTSSDWSEVNDQDL